MLDYLKIATLLFLQKSYLLLPLILGKMFKDIDVYLVTLFVTLSSAMEILTQLGFLQVLAQKKIFLQKNYEIKILFYSSLRILLVLVFLAISFFIFREIPLFFWFMLFSSLFFRFLIHPSYYKNTAVRSYGLNIRCELVSFLLAYLPFTYFCILNQDMTEALLVAILLYNLFRTLISYKQGNSIRIELKSIDNFILAAEVHKDMFLIWLSNLLIFLNNFLDKIIFAFISPLLFANLIVLQRFLQVMISEPSLVLGQKLFLDSSYDRKYLPAQKILMYFFIFSILVNVLGLILIGFCFSLLSYFNVNAYCFVLVLNIALFGAFCAILSQLLKAKGLNCAVLRGQVYQVFFVPLSICGLIFYGFNSMLAINLSSLIFTTCYYHRRYKLC